MEVGLSGDEFPDYLAAELTDLLEAAPMKILWKKYLTSKPHVR